MVSTLLMSYVLLRGKPAEKGLSSTDSAFRTPFNNLLGQGQSNTSQIFVLEKEPPTHPTVQGQWGKARSKQEEKNFLAKFHQQIKWGLKERDELLKSVPIKCKAKTNWQYSAGFMSHWENGTVGTCITHCNTFCPCFKSSLLSTPKTYRGCLFPLEVGEGWFFRKEKIHRGNLWGSGWGVFKIFLVLYSSLNFHTDPSLMNPSCLYRWSEFFLPFLPPWV